MLNNHIIPGCPYVKELEWSVRTLCAWHSLNENAIALRPLWGTVPYSHATVHTSPSEALTAFGYVKMEFIGLRFQAFYYGILTRLYYIYGISSKMFYPKMTFLQFPTARPQKGP